MLIEPKELLLGSSLSKVFEFVPNPAPSVEPKNPVPDDAKVVG
jgi:hypothetical protein